VAASVSDHEIPTIKFVAASFKIKARPVEHVRSLTNITPLPANGVAVTIFTKPDALAISCACRMAITISGGHGRDEVHARSLFGGNAGLEFRRSRPQRYVLGSTVTFVGCLIMYGDPEAWLKLVGVVVNTNSLPEDWLMAYR
jgi:hypothetical protein